MFKYYVSIVDLIDILSFEDVLVYEKPACDLRCLVSALDMSEIFLRRYEI